MNLHAAIEAFVALKQKLGCRFLQDAGTLRAFGRFAGDMAVESISTDACTAFCRGQGTRPLTTDRKRTTLHGLFRFLTGRGHIERSPLPENGAHVQRTFVPYIYSRDELKKLLVASEADDVVRQQVGPLMLRTLFLTIYATGLRAGEALRLSLDDVDLNERVLTIRTSKFYKSRYVPFGTNLGNALKRWYLMRMELPLPQRTASTLFATHAGWPILICWLEKAFRRMTKKVGVQRPGGSRWQPRIHDLRHSFAVHRLTAWYRNGDDVQVLLPILSTYLGHFDLNATLTYLSITEELLSQASQRFERYAFRQGEPPCLTPP